MLINPELIQRSIARALKSKPERAAERLGEGDRSRGTNAAQREERYAALLAETGSAIQARVALERLLGGNDLSPISYLERGMVAARSVCRIRLRDSSGATVGFGTGFLIGPGALLTNHHVIASVAEARGALAEFDYEYDMRGQDKPLVVFQVRDDPPPIPFEPLDYCLVAVAPRSLDGQRALAEYGWLRLNPTPGKAVVGEYLTIIQHPGGERKQICVRENKLIKYDEAGDTLWYKTDTLGGSSGSPVFNNSWQVVALHHSGVPEIKNGHWMTIDDKVWDRSMDESRIKWIANEGMRISRIIEQLQGAHADHPLVQGIVEQLETPGVLGGDSEVGRAWDGAGPTRSQLVDGELRMEIPVRVSVRVGGEPRRGGESGARAPGAAAAAVLRVPVGIEKVDVDQTNYGKRTGYQDDFLGSGALAVPLPVVKKAGLKAQVLKFKVNGKQGHELKYWNYSVVMHRGRKLALFSAVNVDANQRPAGAGRDGDVWYRDTRIPDDAQIGAEFYAEQKELEVDRSKNPFDRGHLTRRLDAQWGGSAALAKRNGDDSFHWTNCAPQHWRFNQGSKRWLGLEDYVIQTFAGSARACVINGPVFDAPLSKEGQDGRVIPTLKGKAHADPTFGGVAVPKLFFKIVACRRAGGGLGAAAFLMSQEDYLTTVDRLKGMPKLAEERLTAAEARLYQVRVAEIEALTGFDFGPLGAADTKAVEGAAVGPRIIRELADVRV